MLSIARWWTRPGDGTNWWRAGGHDPIQFSVRFHQPFLVRSGQAARGRRDRPPACPASSLKARCARRLRSWTWTPGSSRRSSDARHPPGGLGAGASGRGRGPGPTPGPDRRSRSSCGPGTGSTPLRGGPGRGVDGQRGTGSRHLGGVRRRAGPPRPGSWSATPWCCTRPPTPSRRWAPGATGGMGTVTIRPATPLDRFEQRCQGVVS